MVMIAAANSDPEAPSIPNASISRAARTGHISFGTRNPFLPRSSAGRIEAICATGGAVERWPNLSSPSSRRKSTGAAARIAVDRKSCR